MSNLPPGTTPDDIDANFGEPRREPPEPNPSRPECDQCHAPLEWEKAAEARPENEVLCGRCDDDETEEEGR